MNHPKHHKQGFSLIELLVVMAIIAILASILVPLGSTMLRSAKKKKALGETTAIAMAVKTYQSTYARMPIPGDGGANMASKDIVKVLIGEDAVRNPRNTVYLELESAVSDGTFLDPWGQQYEIYLDADHDGKIDYPAGTIYRTTAIAVSKGPNRTGPAGDSDDIASVR